MTSSNDNSQLVSYNVKVNGSAIPDIENFFSIVIDKSLNKIASAKLVILDGDAATQNFAISSSNTFLPGNKISIEAGYDNQNRLVFEGIITRQALTIEDYLGSALHIECHDQAIKMTLGRKNCSFKKMTDSEIISLLIRNYSGLTADVSSTSSQLPELLQYYTSDWDFMLQRASLNSLVVNTESGKISVFSPVENTTPVLTIGYGENILKFNAELNSISQLGQVKASAWDYKTQQLISAEAINDLAGPGNLSSKKLSEVIGLTEFQIQTTAALDKDNLSDWAKSEMLKSELAKITGQVTILGSTLVVPGATITITGMGDRFSGDHLVSGVIHEFSDGNWTTEVSLGLPFSLSSPKSESKTTSAAGLLPGVHGLYNAKVKKVSGDPDKEHRVLLDLPLFDPTGEGVWARLSNFYSSSGSGAFFLPEIGDEVIVGFLNDAPDFPVILGSLYSSANQAAAELLSDEENSLKAIITKNKLKLVFNEKDNSITLTTPDNNTLLLDQKNKQIRISDQNENVLLMSSAGISLKSPKSINIEAGQNVSIKGDMGVEFEASGGDIASRGLNIKQSADIQFSAEGSATASLQGGSELTLKGAMVMIN